ncbi:MAG: GGDEF domain-containing phosphodiesterase [Bryobacteraceae bacterium]
MIESFESSLASRLTGETPSSLAVLLISLDQVKALGETLGHAIAERVLELAGQRLQSALRKSDTLSQMPDNQFAIILNPVLSAMDAGIIADRLVDLLQRAYLVRGQVVNTGASIGIKLATQSDSDSAILLKRAGMALQCAQSSGPGAVRVFETSIEDRLVARHELVLDLHKALLLHQFEVHYQPQVDIAIQYLTGFEALLRWRHPESGWISPALFIPIAEETGLIEMIGDWVLRTACQEAARLPREIVMAVNVSPLQIRNKSFTASVEHALSVAGIPASRLEIEITEGVLIQEPTSVLETLNDLHSMGVRLAMDDLGTGYSSLGQLARFPFDTIKIDRSLIIDRPTVVENAKQRAIVRAIATLGKGLGMCTLVEGIETEKQLVDAYSDGCISAQGYLFGKAVSAAQLDEVLAAFSRRLNIPLESTELLESAGVKL